METKTPEERQQLFAAVDLAFKLGKAFTVSVVDGFTIYEYLGVFFFIDEYGNVFADKDYLEVTRIAHQIDQPLPDRGLQFFVPGKPRGKGRPRFTSANVSRHAFTPAATREYEKLIRITASRAAARIGWDPGNNGVYLSLEAFFPVPVKWRKEQRRKVDLGHAFPGKPDLDNVLKSFCDALNSVAYLDDKQIQRVWATKRYARQGELPGVRVTVKTLESRAEEEKGEDDETED